MIPAIVEAALRSLLVAAAVWGGLRAFRVRNVLVQKAAWGLVLAAAICMPAIMRWQWLPAGSALVLPAHPFWQAVDPWTRQAPAVAQPKAASPEISQPTQVEANVPPGPAISASDSPAGATRFPAPTVSNVPTGSRVEAPFAAPAPISPRSLSPLQLAALLYLAVCGGLLLRLFYGLAAAGLVWLKAEPVPIRSLPPAFDRLAHGLRLRSSRELASPVTIASGIVLPANYTEWDAEKLRIVLAHEGSHVRQGDFYLQTLAGFYAVLFWFSPLGWWLKRKLSDLSETISDRAGLQQAASGSHYAQILLEFAVAPRPTLQGVAMARPSNLSTRIERLLNDSAFRQAFVGSRRTFVAVLLVPVAIVLATALIRVEAASQAAPQAQPAPATAGQAHPQEAADPASAPEAAEPTDPDAQVEGAPPPPMAPAPPGSVGRDPLPAVAPLPPLPPVSADGEQQETTSVTSIHSDSGHENRREGRHNYSYSFNTGDGESYAVIKGGREKVHISGDFHQPWHDDLEKARNSAHGDFLWFKRDSKSYVVDDPAILAEIDAMYRPMEALGKQQEELGRKQEELGRQQELLGRQQEKASIPTPDISREMAELNASMAKLQAKLGKTVTQDELAELEGKLGDLQGRLGQLQGEIGARQGQFGAQQGKLGAMQGALGAQQGKIGAEQGRLAQEANRKVKSIIDQSLKNGKARPVQ
jgi:hypothetical protein